MKLAVIDIGSNAIKFRLWECAAHAESSEGAAPRLEASAREPVRLGATAFAEDGRLSAQIIAQAAKTIGKLANDARAAGVETIRAVATSAMREAANAAELIEAVRREAGMEIEVLGEADEARLVARGALARHPDAAANFLIFDIGGGSVEIIRGGDAISQRGGGRDSFGKGDAPFVFASLPLGAVRLTQKFFPALPPSASQLAAAEEHIRDALAGACAKFAEAGFAVADHSNTAAVDSPRETPRCLASGGTIHALGIAARREEAAVFDSPAVPRPAADKMIDLRDIEELTASFASLDADGIFKAFPVDAQRAEILFAGALVAREILRRFALPALLPTPTGLADGILAEWQCGLQ